MVGQEKQQTTEFSVEPTFISKEVPIYRAEDQLGMG